MSLSRKLYIATEPAAAALTSHAPVGLCLPITQFPPSLLQNTLPSRGKFPFNVRLLSSLAFCKGFKLLQHSNLTIFFCKTLSLCFGLRTQRCAEQRQLSQLVSSLDRSDTPSIGKFPFNVRLLFKFGFLQRFQAVATLQLDHLPEFLLEPADFLVRLHLALHFLLIHWRQSACRGKAGSLPFLFFCCLDPGMILSPSKRALPCFTCFPLCLIGHLFCLSCFPLCFLFRSRCRFSQSLFPLFYLRFPKKRQHFAIPCHVARLVATATLHSYRCHAVERAGCFQG